MWIFKDVLATIRNNQMPLSKIACIIILDTISWAINLLVPVTAALPIGWLVMNLTKAIPWWGVVALFPIFYLLWVISFLALSAMEMALIGLVHQKAPRLKLLPDIESVFSYAMNCHIYLRGSLIWGLPWINAFILAPVSLPILKRLVVRAYAPKEHIDIIYTVYSWPMDPDLTYIGENVIIGFGCSLIAHGMITRPDGSSFYVSAPIIIESNVTIGGDSRIAMGVKIEEGAIVEVGSNVLPYTRISRGEIWGGNPAVCLRRPETSDKNLLIGASVTRDRLIHIIADAINYPLEDISAELSDENCMHWDSLAKMSIAAAIYDHWGIRIQAGDIFRLSSIAAIEELLGKTTQSVEPSPKEAKVNEPVIADNFKLPENPDLLPLFDPAEVTKRLSQTTSKLEAPHARKVIIAATFTAQPIAPTLTCWCRAFNLPIEIAFADYGQIQQELLDPKSSFHQNANGINIVLVRPEDFIRNTEDDGIEQATRLIESINAYQTTRKGLIVSDMPPVVSPFFSGRAENGFRLAVFWRDRLLSMDGIHVLPFSSVVSGVGIDQAVDAGLEAVTRAPFAPKVFQRLGIAITRVIRQMALPAKKVLALDCDNTLWGGIVGEEGLKGLQLSDDHPGRSFRLFQEKVLALKKNGILIVLVSKNLETDVWEVFDDHPEMALKRDDIAAVRINWQPKSANLMELAKELNLGLDAFVFMDDSPVERLEVETELPEVTVVPMPDDPALFAGTLEKLWCFDSQALTDEDLQRTRMQTEEQKRRLQQQEMNLDTFLNALSLKADIRIASPNEYSRVTQLTQKTNQFNLSLTRRTLQEIETLASSKTLMILSARDKFGDYGLVGVAILEVSADRVILDTFLMSCRALGRGLELAFLHVIGQWVRNKGGRKIHAPYVKGPRNQPVLTFFSSIGANAIEDCFEISIDRIPEPPKHVELSTP